MGELIEQLLFIGRQAGKEGGVVQQLLALRGWDLLQLAQFIEQKAPPLGRQSLPARQHLLAHLSPFFRCQALPDLRTASEFLPLLGSQPVPLLEALANACLLFGRQTQKPPVVAQKSLLLFRRHILQSLEPPRRERSRRSWLCSLSMQRSPAWPARSRILLRCSRNRQQRHDEQRCKRRQAVVADANHSDASGRAQPEVLPAAPTVAQS